MSLQVWLPLNGNLENRGLYDTEISTLIDSVYSNDSMFNKSWDSQQKNYIKIPITNIKDEITISFWFQSNKPADWVDMINFGNKTCVVRIEPYSPTNVDGTNYYFYYTKVGTTVNYNIPIMYNSNKTSWYHLTMVANRNNFKFYINGDLVKTQDDFICSVDEIINDSQYVLLGSGTSANSRYNGRFNDFRIYNHCLSDKEVKEISKGLYIHYPLNQIDKSNNLIKNSSSGFTGGFNGASNCVNGISDFKNENGIISWNGTLTAKNCGPYFNTLSKFGYTYSIGEIYTISFDARADCDNMKFKVGNICESQTIIQYSDLTLNNNFKRYWIVYTAKATTSAVCFYNEDNYFVTVDKPRIYLKNLKVELGINTNPIWTPNFEDTNKWYDTIEYDMSGFGNDGTLTTTNSNTSSNDTPRNNYSYYLDKNSTYRVQPNYDIGKYVYNCSFGIWCKKITTVNANQNIISFGGNSFMRFRLNPNNTITVFAFLPGTTNSDNIIIPSYVDIYDWNYYMVTFNNGIYKFYLNGELLNTTDKSTTRTFLTYTNSNWFIGRYNISTSVNPECLDGALFSDFRYYVTTLSDKDILELYNRPISLTDKGEIFTQGEIVENEVDAVSYKKNGIMESKSISNIPQILNMETKELDDGSVWAKIFYHNCNAGTVLFTSYKEVMYTDTDNKYSRLNILGNFKGNDDKYEFLLEYPNEFPNQYNRWKQSKNPCDEYYGTSNGELFVDGYEAIHIDWTSQSWGGLARQNSNTQSALSCFLSGSIGSGTWYYSVGASTKWGNGIPGPYGNVANAINVVQLWVRIDNLPQSIDVKLYDKYIECGDIIEY